MISSGKKISNNDKDFITELISEEARKTKGDYSFILHNIIEKKKYSMAIIEGTRNAIVNLIPVLKDNTDYNINYTKY